MYTGPREEDADDAPFQEERAREERARRRDQISRTVVAWVMAGALALLAYDSGGAALDARRDGRPWAYPACIASVCLLGLLGLAIRAFRRRNGRVSHRGPG
ncbi:hypothetical protein [Actinomadura sp. DC4]|uniref:hypothetical protein n=1 Tax=Actinomadura sp. DC4 TaxID=3055069 RepID=UPI0025B0AA88|nr:hypothetical protein [Actinomadura sp. DC4]MDN3359903.1 hypothetical protein [Actinomadura sp. DC4]